ncbi:MAG: SDR family oxidoreductase, partial [Myxococcaceae bacterium]|nr:SDR family oxidoreductase [Myxococcaceae bacterium]MCI0670858.1 SDR family oxidoreductase [Myxococcaceae bacterium]
MDLGLGGKKVLVTGSTAGIGYAAALGFAREGAEVTVNGRTQARVDDAVNGILRTAPGGRVRGVAADLSNAAGAEALIRGAPDVDVLVNNAGIFEPVPFEEITDERWMRMFETNVM